MSYAIAIITLHCDCERLADCFSNSFGFLRSNESDCKRIWLAFITFTGDTDRRMDRSQKYRNRNRANLW